ncbi:hypothetical protein JQX13_32185 [Archangium violaceum]|uniref:hypothetical protein n=1 Tax=Archangium violaceum TaxID=83451 RepID=UPI00193C3258|nr:hypothetical protein [Archangium violaceum]QRK04863.1 hypothetical protein JQX13_32185 [Archangium violaceum]
MAALALLFTCVAAAAPIKQVPEGGRAIPVVQKGIVCGPVGGGWSLSSDGRSVRPPSRDAGEFARTLDLKVAEEAEQCASSQEIVTVIATGAFPNIDAAGTTFFPDEGRIELKGQRLQDVPVAWSVPAKGEQEAAREGLDVCLNPSSGNRQECTVPLTPGLPSDATLYWVPPHGRRGPEVTTYDVNGTLVAPESFQIRPGRIVLTRPLVQSSGVDLSKGPGRVAISHPEAVASVDCAPARCELADGGIAIRNVPGGVEAQVTLRLRLVPRVLLARGDAFDTAVSVTLPVLACPLTAVEDTVLRDVAEPALVVRLGATCGHDPQGLLWTVNGERVEVGRVVKVPDGIYVLLRTEGTSARQLTISAASSPLERTVVASTTAKTLPLPYPRANLELPNHGAIDFIPTNRPALVQVAGSGAQGRFALHPIEGAYRVITKDNTTLVRGDTTAGGFVALRFGYRVPSLPGELASMDLALVDERVQRAVREASVPTNVANLIEFVCTGKDGVDQTIEPSSPYRIHFSMRHTCRVIIHRERLSPEEGIQEIVLRINVTKPDGSSRGESHVEQRMLLRPGGEARVIPIQGNLGQYDRIMVQVAHVADESRYALSATDRAGLPSAQWTALVQGGILRLYATGAVPAGLYRVTKPSGQLTLNFGVLSRLVLLNDEGQERLVGIEIGLMGLGLIPQSSDIHFPPTLALVGGLGLRVPIGTGAAVGVQAWIAHEFRGDITRNLKAGEDPDTTDLRVPSSKWSFMFGPSISIGNVGFNL